jgi:hypothetical protein
MVMMMMMMMMVVVVVAAAVVSVKSMVLGCICVGQELI